jgi:hypothetical protein
MPAPTRRPDPVALAAMVLIAVVLVWLLTSTRP